MRISIHRDKGDAVFHQPPCQESALAPAVAPIAVAEPRVLPGNVERFARLPTGNDVKSRLIESIQDAHHPAGVEVPAGGVEMGPQGPPVVETIKGQAAYELKVIDPEAGVVGVGGDTKRVARAAEVGGVVIGVVYRVSGL